ncbi:MAG: D-alanyl-D-alanine carboxypeptidase [Defluviitaleaceae bacterium]|nr:D-alanyl-D-alanine carboxypeptidase [Defluviitaleaceae bacterium]
MRKIAKSCVFFIILLTLAAPGWTYAHTASAPELDVHAQTHILIEADTGRILSQHEPHQRMFPAATTMILTAILAYEHIGLDEIVIAGGEVALLPPTSARNRHEVGEAISGENLLRGMLIGAGNDTANTVVMEVARRRTGNEDIAFAQAQTYFAALMTERATQLGAENSRFVNPHGYHHGNHYTTAYDMAQIARHAMAIPAIAQIAGAGTFSGPSASGQNVSDDMLIRNHNWRSANELLHSGQNHYPYATGLRTGFTNQAGESLVATAYKDGTNLIAVTFSSPIIDNIPTRWQDSISLFEYGFANYAHSTFLEADTIIGQLDIYDPQMGDSGVLEFFTLEEGTLFLSGDEIARLARYVEFLPQFVGERYNEYTSQYQQMALAPIEAHETIGTVIYRLDGDVVFSAPMYADRYVTERTTASDIDYYLAWVNEVFFSAASIPYWIAGVSVLTLAILLIVLAKNAIKRNRRDYKYKWKY